MTPVAYAGLLKRRPVQARSIARVEAILDAGAALLADGDAGSLTMRAIATRAGVPVATIYQFFTDKHALVQAVALRYVQATPGVLDAVLDEPVGSPSETVSRVVDAYAAMLAGAPAMRALWLADAMDDGTAADAGAADDEIAERLRRHLTDPSRSDPADWRFLVTLVSQLLRVAFTIAPEGDAATVARARHAAGLYAADLVRRSGGHTG